MKRIFIPLNCSVFIPPFISLQRKIKRSSFCCDFCLKNPCDNLMTPVLLSQLDAIGKQTYSSHYKKDLHEHIAHKCIPFGLGLQADAIKRFLKGKKRLFPNPRALLNLCEKNTHIYFESDSTSPGATIGLVQSISDYTSGIYKRKRAEGEELTTNPMGIQFCRSLFLNHLLAPFTVVGPAYGCCSMRARAQGTQDALTCTNTKALSFNLHVLVLCKHRSDQTHWAMSLTLIRLFVLQFPPCSYPCFVHCHSNGIMGCFHHEGTSAEAARGNAKKTCCFPSLITRSVIITCYDERHSLGLSWELIIIL